MRTDVHFYAIPGDRYALVRGRVSAWFKREGIPALRTAMHGGYWLRAERVSDVVARLEIDGYRVHVRRHSAPRYVPPALIEEVVTQ